MKPSSEQSVDVEFLPDPSAIRRALARGIRAATSLDMAVAFVGRDWQEILGEFDGPIRLVCWLDSTNTNPIAVDQLRVHGADVRQLTKMHAKVYVARGDQSVAIVGSANLSQSALAEDYAVGQVEAAVALREPGRIAKVHEWFEVLWNERAVEITPRDLSAA